MECWVSRGLAGSGLEGRRRVTWGLIDNEIGKVECGELRDWWEGRRDWG